MKKITLLIILAIFTMSSKNNTPYVICVCDMPNMVVTGINTKGQTVYADQDVLAIKFATSQLAQNYILSLDESVGFFGTRPTRPK